MYEMIMTNALDANACLTPRGVTLTFQSYLSIPEVAKYTKN
jgi:hypothetical protein